MATKPGRVVTYDKKNSLVMSDDPLITWSCEVTWLIRSLLSPLSQGLWPSNMTGWRTYLWLEEPTYGLIWSSDKVVMCGDVTKQKCNISSLIRPMAMKLGKLMTYGEVNAPVKSHVLLTSWLHKVTWQTKNVIFLPPEDLWRPNFAGCWHMVRQSP